jgi:hypothetical protein
VSLIQDIIISGTRFQNVFMDEVLEDWKETEVRNVFMDQVVEAWKETEVRDSVTR